MSPAGKSQWRADLFPNEPEPVGLVPADVKSIEITI